MSEETANVDKNPMTGLSPDRILHRAPGLKLHLRSDNYVRVSLDEETVTCGPHALAILDVFYQPTSFSEALRKLSRSSSGVQDWAALTSTIGQLYRAGVLQDETGRRAEAGYGFGSPSGHVAMLNDRIRISSFLAGINEVVTPEDVVVDIGTGTGVLALAAARAGAKHVYAIEASDIGESAQAIFEANGLADRITLMRGWSTRIALPEHADVLVSEIIGNDPLGEEVLQVTMDARKRLLGPEARFIPNKVRVLMLPVAIPRDERMKRLVTEENLRNWYSWYGIEFDPLIQVKRNPFSGFYIKPQRAHGWKTLGEPILLADVDLSAFHYPISLDHTTTFVAHATGKLDGLLMYFELRLGPTTRLSTHPAQADIDNHWSTPVWVLDNPLALKFGDRIQVTCKYRPGDYRIAVTRA